MTITVNQITEDTCVDDLITDLPETAQVFVRHRMSCVGCDIARFESVADVCRVYRQPIDELLEEIRQVLRQAQQNGSDDLRPGAGTDEGTGPAASLTTSRRSPRASGRSRRSQEGRP